MPIDALRTFLAAVARGRIAGVLTLRQGEVVASLRVDERGFVTPVKGTRPPTLGALLVARGLVAPADLERAYRGSGAAPGAAEADLLVAAGLADAATVERAVVEEARAQARVIGALDTPRGWFTPAAPGELGRAVLPAEVVLLETYLARSRVPEQSPVAAAWDLDWRLELGAASRAMPAGPWWSEGEWRLVEAVRGRGTLREWLAGAPSPLAAHAMLTTLLRCGYLVEPAQARARGEARPAEATHTGTTTSKAHTTRPVPLEDDVDRLAATLARLEPLARFGLPLGARPEEIREVYEDAMRRWSPEGGDPRALHRSADRIRACFREAFYALVVRRERG